MQRRNCKKIGSSLLAWLLIFTMLASGVLVNAEDHINIKQINEKIENKYQVTDSENTISILKSDYGC